MTKDEIIRMAREAGLIQYVQVEKTCVSNALERFAALVAANERERQAEQQSGECTEYYKGFQCGAETMKLVLEQAEQEPIRFIWNGEGWIEADDYIWKTTDDHERRILYAAPVRTKDLTDDEIELVVANLGFAQLSPIEVARAVIAADREKNK